MQKLIRGSALLMVVLLAVVASRVPVAMAQDDGTTESAFDDLTQLEGLETAVQRDWSVDYEELLISMASPDANTEFTDIEYPDGIQYLGAYVLRFDGDDNAEAAFTIAQEEVSAESIEGDEFAAYEEIEVDDFGDNTLALGETLEDATMGSTSSVIFLTQEGEYLYLTLAFSINEDINDQVSEIVRYMVDEDAGDGDGEFNAAGTSEGGLWDKFPDADDELIGQDLIVYDYQLFPVPEEEVA